MTPLEFIEGIQHFVFFGTFLTVVGFIALGIIVVVMGFFLLIAVDDKQMMKKAKQKEEDDLKKRKQERAAMEISMNEDERRSLSYMHEHSQSMIQSLGELLTSAEGWLDAAERDFEERAFAPFWDAIEQAANSLGSYHDYVGKVAALVLDHKRRRDRLSDTIPALALPESGLPDARIAATRLFQLGRRAQRDFQFATIYEQRKTNQLLHSGFGTLAAGLQRMQGAITDALDDLSQSLGTRLDDILTVTTSQVDDFNSFSESAQKHFDDSDRETKKQSEMLDNIQRGKKPPEGTLDRVFHYRPDGDTRTPHDVSADD